MRLTRLSAGRYQAEGEPFAVVSIGSLWFVVINDDTVASGPFDTKRAAASWLADTLLERRTVA